MLYRPFFLLAILTAASFLACDNVNDEVRSDAEPCREFFASPDYSYEKLQKYTVPELLIIQKCGLAFRPQRQMSWYIANQDVYPIPHILDAIESESDENFKLHLIIDIAAVSESEKHRDTVRGDQDKIIMAIQRAIETIEDLGIKELSMIELERIRNELIV